MDHSQLTDHSSNSQTTPLTHRPRQLTDHAPNSQTTPTHRPRQLTDHANSQIMPPTHRPRQLTDHSPNSQTTPPIHGPSPCSSKEGYPLDQLLWSRCTPEYHSGSCGRSPPGPGLDCGLSWACASVACGRVLHRGGMAYRSASTAVKTIDIVITK